MLTDDQVKIIHEFVPETYFDQERLIKYLNTHNTVGIEIFEYVAKEVYPKSKNRTAVPDPAGPGPLPAACPLYCPRHIPSQRNTRCFHGS